MKTYKELTEDKLEENRIPRGKKLSPKDQKIWNEIKKEYGDLFERLSKK